MNPIPQTISDLLASRSSDDTEKFVSTLQTAISQVDWSLIEESRRPQLCTDMAGLLLAALKFQFQTMPQEQYDQLIEEGKRHA